MVNASASWKDFVNLLKSDTNWDHGRENLQSFLFGCWKEKPATFVVPDFPLKILVIFR